MATNADIGFGTLIGVWNGASYTNFAEITAVDPPGLEQEAVEATHMQSPGRFREFVPGLRDGGESPVTLNWFPAVNDAARAAFLAGKQSYRITGKGGVTCTFDGFITSLNHSTPIDGKMEQTFVIKVSGQPVWA